MRLEDVLITKIVLKLKACEIILKPEFFKRKKIILTRKNILMTGTSIQSKRKAITETTKTYKTLTDV